MNDRQTRPSRLAAPRPVAAARPARAATFTQQTLGPTATVEGLVVTITLDNPVYGGTSLSGTITLNGTQTTVTLSPVTGTTNQVRGTVAAPGTYTATVDCDGEFASVTVVVSGNENQPSFTLGANQAATLLVRTAGSNAVLAIEFPAAEAMPDDV